MKKLLSILLITIMTFCALPAFAFADATASVSTSGAKAQGFLAGKQDSILKANTKSKAKYNYTILSSYYPYKKDVNSALENCGYTYDNALTAIAFISSGEQKRAAYILDSFAYALKNDRSGEKKIRNAYRSGNPYDKSQKALLPGFWTGNSWAEDAYQVGSNLGNISWAAIAMLQYDSVFKTDKYLSAASGMMDYVLANFKTDSNPGFTSGYDGWAENGSVTRYTYKSLECNLDACVAFKELYAKTGKSKYQAAYEDCLGFVKGLYVPSEKRFVVGTTTDGVTHNTSNTFLDCQAWTILALGDELEDKQALAESLKNMTTEGGLPFVALGLPSEKRFESKGGIWYEGSIFGSMALKKAGCDAEASAIMETVIAGQSASGGFTAASTSLFADNSWRYDCETYHIAPAAWMVMYANDFNPFDFKSTAAKVSKPAQPTGVTLKSGKKSITVKWTAAENATGYQIRYSLYSSMKKSTTVKLSDSSVTSKTIKKLKSKKKYYVQVRSVRGGKYSAWTSKKSIKTK